MSNVVAAHSLCYHQYADMHSAEHVRLTSLCHRSIQDTLTVRRRRLLVVFPEQTILLNPSKTEAVLFGTRIQRNKVQTSGGIDIAGTLVPFRDTVELLGGTLDSGPSLHRGCSQLQLSHLGALWYIRPLLTPGVTRMVGTQHCHI